MQIRKFINMEPPDAAVPRVYSFHLRDARVSSPFRIHLYSATFIIALFLFPVPPFKEEARCKTDVYTCACSAVLPSERKPGADHVQIMGLSACTIYCPPSTRFLYKFCALHEQNRSPARLMGSSSSGDASRHEILSIS